MAVDPTGNDLKQLLADDPDYQQFTHFRTDALEEAVLQATVPWGAS